MPANIMFSCITIFHHHHQHYYCTPSSSQYRPSVKSVIDNTVCRYACQAKQAAHTNIVSCHLHITPLRHITQYTQYKRCQHTTLIHNIAGHNIEEDKYTSSRHWLRWGQLYFTIPSRCCSHTHVTHTHNTIGHCRHIIDIAAVCAGHNVIDNIRFSHNSQSANIGQAIHY